MQQFFLTASILLTLFTKSKENDVEIFVVQCIYKHSVFIFEVEICLIFENIGIIPPLGGLFGYAKRPSHGYIELQI